MHAVSHLHDHVIDVVGSGIGRSLEVRRTHEGQRAGGAVDLEPRSVGATDDVVTQRVAIGVGGGHGGDGAAALDLADRSAGATAVAGDHRCVVIEVEHGDADRLGVVCRAVAHAHAHLVNVVAIGIQRHLVVGRACKAQCTGAGVDGEAPRVGAAHDAVAQRVAIDVRRRHGGDRGRSFVDRHRGAGATAVARDDGCIVDRVDGDGHGVHVGGHTAAAGVAQVAGGHRQRVATAVLRGRCVDHARQPGLQLSDGAREREAGGSGGRPARHVEHAMVHRQLNLDVAAGCIGVAHVEPVAVGAREGQAAVFVDRLRPRHGVDGRVVDRLNLHRHLAVGAAVPLGRLHHEAHHAVGGVGRAGVGVGVCDVAQHRRRRGVTRVDVEGDAQGCAARAPAERADDDPAVADVGATHPHLPRPAALVAHTQHVFARGAARCERHRQHSTVVVGITAHGQGGRRALVEHDGPGVFLVAQVVAVEVGDERGVAVPDEGEVLAVGEAGGSVQRVHAAPAGAVPGHHVEVRRVVLHAQHDGVAVRVGVELDDVGHVGAAHAGAGALCRPAATRRPGAVVDGRPGVGAIGRQQVP